MPSALPFVVVTSIFLPTAAVRCFAERTPGRLIVVGDQKTPAGWSLPQAEYLAPEAQVADGGALAGLLLGGKLVVELTTKGC